MVMQKPFPELRQLWLWKYHRSNDIPILPSGLLGDLRHVYGKFGPPALPFRHYQRFFCPPAILSLSAFSIYPMARKKGPDWMFWLSGIVFLALNLKQDHLLKSYSKKSIRLGQSSGSKTIGLILLVKY